MSRRGRAAYHAAIERPISWCANAFTGVCCRNQNARYSKLDGKRLCAACRAQERAAISKSSTNRTER